MEVERSPSADVEFTNLSIGVEIKEEVTTRFRQLKGIPRAIVVLGSLTTIGIVVYYIFRLSFIGIFNDMGYYYLLIALLLPLVFLLMHMDKRSSRDMVPWYDALLAFLAFGIPFYFFLVSAEIPMKGWEVIAPDHVKIISLVLLILVVEASRRSVGLIFAAIVLFFGCFPLFASYVPPPFQGMAFPFWRMVSLYVMGADSLLGVPIRVVGTLLIGFLIFAVGLISTGGGQFFLNFALSMFGRFRGGPAKVAVIASALFGTISGSAVANVLTTGSVTIPTMKRSGYPAHYAAAVEACASTGGVLMPPVMGATAFLIAQFLGITYAEVCIAAAIPSILYYLGIFIQIDAFAAKTGLKGLAKEDIPSLIHTLKGGWYYTLSFIALLWFLFSLKREAQAPFLALAVLFILSMLRKETRLTPRGIIAFLERAGQTLCDIMAVMLGVGIIIGSLVMPGTAAGFSSEMIRLAGGNVPLLLVFGAVASFILGMGVTITACYVLLVMLLAPALIKAGLDPLGVHLFVMYWGMISYITPPVAVAAFTAAGLAGANPMRTGFRAMALAGTIYLIPFMFVIEPAFLLHGSVTNIILTLTTAVIGVILIGSGMEGYVLGLGRVNYLLRPFLVIAGCLLVYPDWRISIIGACLAALIILIGSKPWLR